MQSPHLIEAARNGGGRECDDDDDDDDGDEVEDDEEMADSHGGSRLTGDLEHRIPANIIRDREANAR